MACRRGHLHTQRRRAGLAQRPAARPEIEMAGSHRGACNISGIATSYVHGEPCMYATSGRVMKSPSRGTIRSRPVLPGSMPGQTSPGNAVASQGCCLGWRCGRHSKCVAPNWPLDSLARYLPGHRDQGQGDSDPRSYFAHAEHFWLIADCLGPSDLVPSTKILQAASLRGNKLEDFAHNALCLIGLEQKLSVRRAVKNDQSFWLGRFPILLANSGESRAILVRVMACHDKQGR